ncbi:FAD-dependent oxidoreductase [Paenibacillus sp. 1011MAR3C5]|uniref:FAD-dependent oxidoreductase n=1 Tax=Paenibacillus sp. 1011MAR3C5 TaxID=1675787 RepID=UPI000E6CB22E|nr:FAD-dependent oxidoreductase [Paenibacillus sp. 1011MAR3C5]RJE87057.1 FAD-dependent oxidoreductase [Paenibacillus sp. 1011MAR3C5]
MGFFQDMLSMFKKRELALIASNKEADGVYTFLFEKDKDLNWQPGQYGLFTITHKKVKNPTKPFSIASAPAENAIRLTMRISDAPSEFKQAMLELKPGMTVKMSGPVGAFSLQDNSPSLLIAGGIGITPIRAIVKQIESEGNRNGRHIQLLYLDSQKSFPYREELDVIADRASIRITYLDSRDGLNAEIVKFAGAHKDSGKYFVAGPKGMVDSIADYLQKNQIPKSNIKKDAFFGY